MANSAEPTPLNAGLEEINGVARALGDFIMEFNKLEQIIRRLICTQFHPRDKDLYILTERIDLMQLIDGYKKIQSDKKVHSLLNDYKNINEQRVKYVHGDWQCDVGFFLNDFDEYQIQVSAAHRFSSRSSYADSYTSIAANEIDGLSLKCAKLAHSIKDYIIDNGLLMRNLDAK